MRYSTPDHAFVGAVGGGFTYDLTERMGVRTDVRLHFSPNRINTSISASPLVVGQSPEGFIASETSPSIQFSNDPTPGVESSSSGPPIVDFETFRGSGLNRRLTVTGGLYFRF